MYKKFFIFLGVLTGVYIIWMLGFNWIYAYMLKFGVTFFTASAKSISTHLEQLSDGQPEFQIIINGARARVPIEPLIMPFVLIMAWQIFSFIFFSASFGNKSHNFKCFYILPYAGDVLTTFSESGTIWLAREIETCFPEQFHYYRYFHYRKRLFFVFKATK